MASYQVDGDNAVLFYVTAGRGTEKFIVGEIEAEIHPIQISTRDGKVFFTVEQSEISKVDTILSLKSVERAFVAVKDYDNSSFIHTKRSFLDKLMSVLSNQEYFVHAEAVISQRKCLMSLPQVESSEDYEVRNAKTKSNFIQDGDTESRVAEHDCRFDSECCDVIGGNLNLPHDTNPDMEDGTTDRNAGISQTAGQTDFNHTRKRKLLISDSSYQWKRNSQSVEDRYQKRRGVTDNNGTASCQDLSGVDHAQIVPSDTTIITPVHSVESSHTTQRDAHHSSLDSEKYRDQWQTLCLAKEDTNRTFIGTSCVMDDKFPRTFRMSIKCSGKVRRWINLKKLSRDASWRVARSSGWTVNLRHPQIEVCVHISDDYVTIGVPLSRYPLSKRQYIMDSGLRAPIAWIMCQLANIQPGDIVLDPMCGKATILLEARSTAQFVNYLGSDISSGQLTAAAQNLCTSNLDDYITLLKADGLNQPYRDNCVDVILCDIPFNQKFLLSVKPEIFYTQFITEMCRVLRSNGHCVLLVSQDMKQTIIKITEKFISDKERNSAQTLSSDTSHLKGDSVSVMHSQTCNKDMTSKSTFKSDILNSNPPAGFLPQESERLSGPEETHDRNRIQTLCKISKVIGGNSTDKIVTLELNCDVQRQINSTPTQEEQTEPVDAFDKYLPFQQDSKHQSHELTGTSAVTLHLVSDHYVKLGDTHACILVFIKH